MPLLLRLQELQANGDRGWREKKTVFLHRFVADQKIANV